MEQKLNISEDEYINYKLISNNSNKNYIVFYIHGYASSLKATKSTLLEEIAKKHSLDLLKIDLPGHGNSSGDLLEQSFDNWVKCCKIVIEKLTPNKKVLLIGSSIGGYLSYLLTLEMKEKIIGIISISGAVDFFSFLEENLLPDHKDKNVYTSEDLKINLFEGFKISKKLIESGKKYSLLNKEKIEIFCPVWIIHGLKDDIVPYQFSIQFSKKLCSEEVKLFIEKEMNHSLTMKGNMETFEKIVFDFVNNH